MTVRIAAIVVSLGLILCAMPLLAHHSMSSEFDTSRTATMIGTITKIDWTNPHIWIYLSVKDADGKAVEWGVEGAGPNSLHVAGIDKSLLKPGDRVTVEFYAAKNGSRRGGGQMLTLPDGRKLDIHDRWSERSAPAAAPGR